MVKNEQLNELITIYQKTRCEDSFEKLHTMISKRWRNLELVAKSVRSNLHEMVGIYEDTLMECIEIYDGRGDFINLFNRYIWRKRHDVYKVNKSRMKYHVVTNYTEDSNVDNMLFNTKDNFNLEEHVLSKRKTDQRQLIGFLVNGEDETTTAIVEAFLNHPKPTATAIAKELGFHHSKVIRALTRLASKYDTKQFGDYHDYLVAL